MAESIKTTVVENLPENAAPGDADYIITAQKNILKKTKISQLVDVLKEKLGINTLNTKITKLNNLVDDVVYTHLSGQTSILNLGTSFSIHNRTLIYVHIGFSTSNTLAANSNIVRLPVKVFPVQNIGISSVTGTIVAISVQDYNIKLADNNCPAGYYFIDMVFARIDI